MNNKIRLIPQNSYAWLLFAVLFVYLIFRAIFIPISQDEIFTFYFYIQPETFLPPNAHWDANNHLLNSFLSVISCRLFGSEPWALRLPNVLCFILFFYAVWQISKRLNSTFIRWGFLLSLVMAHYMFQYFGQTRGYGLSMAFLLWGILNYLIFTDKKQYKYFVLTIVAMLLATSANLTLLPSSLLFFFALGLFSLFFWKKKKYFLIINTTLFGGFLFLLPLILFSLQFKKRDAFYNGGKSSFWEVTVKSLSELFFGMNHYFLRILFGLMLVIIVITWLIYINKNRINFVTLLTNEFSFFSYLIVMSIIGIIVLRYLLDINFPSDRTAIYLFPYFVGAWAFTLDYLNTLFSSKWKWGSILLFYLPINFLISMDINTISFSTEEYVSKSFFNIIHETRRKSQFPFTVGGYKSQEYSWNYMSYENGGDEGILLISDNIDTLSDYQIVDEKQKIPKGFYLIYDKIKHDPYTNNQLFKRKKAVKQKVILSKDSIETNGITSNYYFNMIHYNIPDSLIGKPLYITLEASVFSSTKPFQANLVVDIFTKDDESIDFQKYMLNWQKKDWNGSKNNLTQGLIIPPLPKESKTLIFYLWNMNSVEFSVKGGICHLFLLKDS
jgi:hypothetical protein